MLNRYLMDVWCIFDRWTCQCEDVKESLLPSEEVMRADWCGSKFEAAEARMAQVPNRNLPSWKLQYVPSKRPFLWNTKTTSLLVACVKSVSNIGKRNGDTCPLYFTMFDFSSLLKTNPKLTHIFWTWLTPCSPCSIVPRADHSTTFNSNCYTSIPDYNSARSCAYYVSIYTYAYITTYNITHINSTYHSIFNIFSIFNRNPSHPSIYRTQPTSAGHPAALQRHGRRPQGLRLGLGPHDAAGRGCGQPLGARPAGCDHGMYMEYADSVHIYIYIYYIYIHMIYIHLYMIFIFVCIYMESLYILWNLCIYIFIHTILHGI